MKIYFNIFNALFLLIFCISCASKKDIIYFQDIAEVEKSIEYSSLTIQKNDILDVRVTSPDPKISALFSSNTLATGTNNTEIKKVEGYLVDDSGNVSLPILSKVALEGLTTVAAKSKIKELLKDYVLEPVVEVRILNYKVTVLGEVNNPGTYTLFEERITLPQAIGLAGDLTINGRRDKVLLIRNDGETTKTISLDFTKNDIINSQYYFLSQNDIIYVEPNTQRVKSSGLVGRTGELTSVLSLVLSTIILLTR